MLACALGSRTREAGDLRRSTWTESLLEPTAIEEGWQDLRAIIWAFPWSRVDHGERAWSRLACKPVLDLFDDLVKGTAEQGKTLLRDVARTLTAELSAEERVAVYEYVYYVFLDELVKRHLVHGGLRGCEKLLEIRASRILSEAGQNGSFPPFEQDEGLVAALCCTGQYVPLYTYHAHLTGIPKSILVRTRGADTVRLLAYLAFQMRGFSPVLELHMPKMLHQRFTVEMLAKTFLTAAQIIGANPRIRGTYGAAWFLDPALRTISPSLGEVGAFAGENGTLIVCLGTDPATIADATAKSRTRRQMYEEGRYMPKKYLRLWGRRRILEWAKTQAHPGGLQE